MGNRTPALAGPLILEIHPAALREAEAAKGWYAERSKRAADAFADEIEHAVEQIVEAPHRWPSQGQGVREHLLQRFPYRLVYAVEANQIILIAVAHQHRRPDYWNDRIP